MTSIVGKAQINQFRGLCVKQALSLHVKTDGRLRATREATPTNTLRWATEYTGKAYKRGQHVQALADMEEWWKGVLRERAAEDALIQQEIDS